LIISPIKKAEYPDFIGRRAILVGKGTGPTTYSQTTGDVVSLVLWNYYIDAIPGGIQSVSGNYWVQPRPAAIGVRQTWSLFWFVTSTGLQVANGFNLSAESLQLAAFIGQF
jgi:hypothetical protein